MTILVNIPVEKASMWLFFIETNFTATVDYIKAQQLCKGEPRDRASENRTFFASGHVHEAKS